MVIASDIANIEHPAAYDVSLLSREIMEMDVPAEQSRVVFQPLAR